MVEEEDFKFRFIFLYCKAKRRNRQERIDRDYCFMKLLGADCCALFDEAVSALIQLSDTPYDLHRDSLFKKLV